MSMQNNPILPAWAGKHFHWHYVLANNMPYPVHTGVYPSQLAIPETHTLQHCYFFGRHGCRYAAEHHEYPETWFNRLKPLFHSHPLTKQGCQLWAYIQAFIEKYPKDKEGQLSSRGYTEALGIGYRIAGSFRNHSIELTTGTSQVFRANQTQDAFCEGAAKNRRFTHHDKGTSARFFVNPHDEHESNHLNLFFHRYLKPAINRARQPDLEFHSTLSPNRVVNMARHFIDVDSKEDASEFLYCLYRLVQQEEMTLEKELFIEKDSITEDDGKIAGVFAQALLKEKGTEIYSWLRDMVLWEYYYYFGNAHQNQNCQPVLCQPILFDMVETLHSNVNTGITAYFGHDGAVAGLLSVLGLLSEQGYDTHRMKSWRDYGHITMGANICVQLITDESRQHFVRLLVNERLVPWPFVQHDLATGIPLIQFQEHYKAVLSAIPDHQSFADMLGRVNLTLE
ncbi:histidine-type phosphatase [Vibrio penaeicida]|uniref:histidine-type phosphatase n=1 Tax=Vibrio penaeicida TaxID=104609 RepID=UPI000CE9F3B8|nr:histidine-type phosphatase [Vibrio penaeicida]